MKELISGKRRAVVGLLAIGLLLRLAVAVFAISGPYNPDVRLGGDAGKYIALGISLSRGEGFSLHYQRLLPEVLRGDAVNPPLAIPTSSRSPGYPLFLSLAFLTFGYSLRSVVVLQAILSTFTALFVYLTARELKARPLLALGFAVFYYPCALEPVFVMSDWFFTLCTAASLWLIVRSRNGLAAGITTGLTILVKSVSAPVLGLAGIVMFGRRAWIFLAGVLMVLAPWGFRNYTHTGIPYVTPSYPGYPPYLLHNPWNREFPTFDRPGDINEYYPGFQEALLASRARAPRVADPVAQEYLEDVELARDTVRFMRADPAQALRAAGRTFANTWLIDYPTANRVRWLSNLVLYVGLLPFAFWGSIQAIRRGPPGARLLAFFLLYFIGVHAILASEIRYRTSAMPAYFVLAAYGISVLETRKR